MGLSMPVQPANVAPMGDGATSHPPLPKALTKINPQRIRNLDLHGERAMIDAEAPSLWNRIGADSPMGHVVPEKVFPADAWKRRSAAWET